MTGLRGMGKPYNKKSFETDIDDLLLETSIEEQENDDNHNGDDDNNTKLTKMNLNVKRIKSVQKQELLEAFVLIRWQTLKNIIEN